MTLQTHIKAIFLTLLLMIVGVGESVGETTAQWNEIYGTWNSSNASVSVLPGESTKMAFVLSTPRGTLFTNSTVTGGYLLSNVLKTAYHTNSSSADFQFLLYPTGNTNGYYVYSVGLRKFVGAHSGQSVIMSDTPVEQFLYKHNISTSGVGTGVSNQPTFNYTDFPFSFSHVNNTVGQTIIVSNWNNGGDNLYGTRGGAGSYDGGNVYKVVEAGNVSDEIYNEFLAKLGIQSWTARITNNSGSGSYKLVYKSRSYSDSETFMALSALSPADVTTDCTDKFVWGPVIDTENNTVTFEIRSVQETSIESGRFYQLQMRDKSGTVVASGNTWTTGVQMAQTVSAWPMRYPGSQIYMTGNNTTDTWCTSLTGIPTDDKAYETYMYVPLGITALQMLNGGYIANSSKYSASADNLSLSYNSSTHSFTWSNNVFPWYGLVSSKAGVGQASGYGSGHIELLFHPVTTGEDYDIYKVMNVGNVVCTNASIVTTINNAGGTYLFFPKGTVLTTSDFLLEEEEPSAISPVLNNGVMELTLTEAVHDVTDITSLSQITDMRGYYRLTTDIASPAQVSGTFRGHLDGGYHRVTGVTEALFENLDGAHVKNLIIEDANISGTTVGAIANTATGNSRVYNCGVLKGTVSGSTEAGSIVGRIEGNARVINCYSYANVSGGMVAGIVGNNAGTSATVFNGTGTLVMNCAHFGKLSGTRNYPVFGGNDIDNVQGVNTYNYYLYDATITYVSPNSAMGTEETSFFNRFDFYRSILNSHKELAAMYLFGTQDITDAQRDEIAHWTYNSTVAQYLSQEQWPANTKRTLERTIPVTAEAYKGKKVGTVSATFSINGTNKVVELPITDMDTDRWDYTYGKVVLPFANEFEGWSLPASGSTAYDNIITGWEVTSITGGTAGTYANYNLCDPDCTNKDLYANNNYVWAQGGNFVVPKGVTAITFTAHVGRAVYLRDTHPDIAYSANYGTRYNLGTQVNGTYNGKTVYNSMNDAFAQLEAKTNPADQAIVLVGNYHYNRENVFPNAYGGTSPVADKAVTIMSIDADNNQEPDYCFYQYNTSTSGRVVTPPLRFDFVTSPGFAMASYTKGGYLAEIGIVHAGGWFETTETATLKMTEFEMRPQNYSQQSPLILNGGVFEKIVMTSTNEYGAATNNLLYTKIGGKAYINALNLGRANGVNIATALALKPLNVSGGEIVNCHLTGAIHGGTTSGDAYFWCNGGYIHEFNGAYQERLNGNMVAMMDHALIDEFYGGGADDAYNDAQISGDINITCNNSYIKFFCGGPKFGNMASGKTVTVNATGSTFDEYYGASYGGTALTTNEKAHTGTSFSGNQDITFALAWTNYTNDRLSYNNTYKGIGADFDLDFFQYAGGGQSSGNQSFYVKYASLSLAQTGSVTSTMTNCTFNGDFFGGGCRGKVAGDVTSTLTNCTVNGNAYAGGYTPTATECMVYPASPQPVYPVYRGLYGLFTKYVRTAEAVPFKWAQADGGHAAGTVDEANRLLYTGVDMSQMGSVSGNTSLTIAGNQSVIVGDVYGGGAESTVSGNAEVTINAGSFGADIFGGGMGQLNDDGTVKASADIGGNTTVTINGGEFAVKRNKRPDTPGASDGRTAYPFLKRYNIYAGGNKACKVGTLDGGGNLVANTGNTYLKMGKGMISNTSDGTDNFLVSEEGAMDLVYESEGKMFFCAFGGGYGKNTSVLGDTHVDFNVKFPGCKDIKTVGLEDDLLDYQSVLDVVGGGFNGDVKGNTYVHVGGDAMCRNLYGGGLYATIGGTTAVDVTGGNIDNVYGGGVMGDILGTDGEGNSTIVTIGLHANKVVDPECTFLKENDKITILGSVYGGNDVSGHVGTAAINHLGGTINQNIYGAGNGNYQGYYTPNRCAFNDGENDNYFLVDHSVNDDLANCGRTYKGRPQTDNVKIMLNGCAAADRAIVMGQVFGGGNSCTIGQWDASLLTTTYHGNPHEVRDDPDYFLGGGNLDIHFGSHVKIGYTDKELAGATDGERELYMRRGNNVSGLFMGCSGDALATQTLSPDDDLYHHYYDAATKKYWQGFAVYAGDGTTPLTRAEGSRAFHAYLNNLLIWSDNVSLTFENDATDVWLANFFGGGFRGSMKAKTNNGKFDYTLPQGVTIGNTVAGGSYNAEVIYRIYNTLDGHVYTTDGEGNYQFLTNTDGLLDQEQAEAQHKEADYVDKLYDDDGNITGLVRFKYVGGILAENDGEGNEVATRRYKIATGEFSEAAADALKNNIAEASAKALVRLNLFNRMEPSLSAAGVVSGGNVFGGCYESGIVNGDSWVNYACTVTDAVIDGQAHNTKDGFGMANQAQVNIMLQKAEDYNTNFGLMLFGAGYGKHTEMYGDCFTCVGSGSMLYNAFGGSYKGRCDGRTFMFCDAQNGIVAGHLYGGSSMGDIGRSSYAYVNSGNISYVYGGNDVCGKIADHTYVLVRGGTVFGDIYGAGNGNYLYQVDGSVIDIVAKWSNELNRYIYRVPVPAKYTSPLTTEDKLDIINDTRPSVVKAIIDLRGAEPVPAVGGEPAKEAEYLYINGSVYVGGNSSTVTDNDDPVDLKVGKYVVLNNLFLGSNGEHLKEYEYVSNIERLNDIKLNTNALLDRYMNGAVSVGNLSPAWATAFSNKNNYEETYIGNLCLGGNAGSMLANRTLTLTIPETVTMFGNFITGSKDAVFKYRQAEHRGGMISPMEEGHENDPKLVLYIRNKWENKKLDFMPANAATHYLVDNYTADGQAYAEGCNIYGGCYESGTMVGSIKMYVESDILNYSNNASFNDDKLNNSNARNITVGNIYGAGYGPESRNYGNVDVVVKDIPDNPLAPHPSVNNIYGGGRNGVLVGNSNIQLHDGLVYNDVVGGCFAANLYGSTNIAIGYPEFYICKQSGKYTIQRSDTWNTGLTDNTGRKVLENEIYCLKGDIIPRNIYGRITGFNAIGSETAALVDITATKADYFTYVNEANTSDPTVGNVFPSGGWNDVNIHVRGGVYGGGYSLNNSTAANAGSFTTCKMTADFNHNRDQSLGLTPGQTTVGYGGNASIIVADNVTLSNNHIQISQNGVGGIFGDGHLVFCEGFRSADITGYGYGGSTVAAPLLLNTFQRFDMLDINDCCMKLEGAHDFAADQTDATIYSMARVNELRMNSTIDASGNLPALSASKSRNYVLFNNNVHLLGSLISNDSFEDAFHDYTGVKGSNSYKATKQQYITAYAAAGDKASALAEFKRRNLGTARNMIGLNSGYALRIQNQYYEAQNAKTYYGPVIGVCEVRLATLVDGEGGGYVYADNIHDDAHNFLNTSGNFVFPGVVTGAVLGDQFIVDDCFPKHFGSEADKVTEVNGSSAEAHYWYVEGNKYFYNTTLTGYTYQTAQTFRVTDNDSNVLLAGVEAGKKLRVASVGWLTDDYPAGYQTDLKDISSTGYTPTPLSSEPAYTFTIKVGDKWNDAMGRSTDMAAKSAKAYTNGENVLPIFDIELADNVKNDGMDYYTAHLSHPEKVQIVLEALDKSDVVVNTYTVNLSIAYVLGPTYTGHVIIRNCAMPGEHIGFGSDNIKITTSDQMPITSTGWKFCPPVTPGSEWTSDEAQGAITIPETQYESDLSGGSATGWVYAQHIHDGWNIAYTFTAGGHEFTVLSDYEHADKEYEKYLVVHNYYRMAAVEEDGEQFHLHPGYLARVYIENEKDLRALFSYLNRADGVEKTAATDNHKYTIPQNLAGVQVIMQNDITLSQPLPVLIRPFAGNLHGDGYHIDLNGQQATLFGDNLTTGFSYANGPFTGTVYNLGVIGGTVTTLSGNDADAGGRIENGTNVKNSFQCNSATDDIKYGKMAYTLSRYYQPDSNPATQYVEQYFDAEGDYQYARRGTSTKSFFDGEHLRTDDPNYGSVETNHRIQHDHDTRRWDEVNHRNNPLNGTAYDNDYMFFGQHLDKDAADTYPTHLDASIGNRIYLAKGYYKSKTEGEFYHNSDAWALHPDLTAVNFDGAEALPVTFGNTENVTGNLLVYGADAATKADGSENYHHVTGTPGSYVCADLALVDKEAFNAPFAFTATRASYVRNPQEETGYATSVNAAWQSLALPFAVQKATLSNGIDRRQDADGNAMIYAPDNHGQYMLRTVDEEGENQTEITYFWGMPTEAMLADPKTNDRTLNHEYWMREFVSVADNGGKTYAEFKRPCVGSGTYATSFQSYMPYIFALPGNKFREFDMTGQTITFSAENAPVAVTDDATKATVSGSMQHVAEFIGGTPANSYAIDPDGNGNSFDAGVEVLPFRTYLAASPSLMKMQTGDLFSKRVIHIGSFMTAMETFGVEEFQEQDSEATPWTDNYLRIYPYGKAIIVESGRDRILPCHGISGTRIGMWEVRKGVNTFSNLRSGIYILGSTKVVVRQ